RRQQRLPPGHLHQQDPGLMQLNLIIAALAFGVAGAFTGPAAAQSLSPMHNSGTTPTDVKGFKLLIGNPYKTRMIFDILAMDPKFKVLAKDAEVNFPEIAMAPNTTRQVIVYFKIEPPMKERTIGVCVQPKDLAS